MEEDILTEIGLPNGMDLWHGSGNLSKAVILTMARLIYRQFPAGMSASAETGAGKSTVLYSILSKRHLCFTVDDRAVLDIVRGSPHFKKDTVRFVLGPSQKTLPQHVWDTTIDLALIDGAHAYPYPDMDYWAFYPQINTGGLLIIDDINIPTIRKLFDFLVDETMFELSTVEDNTAFFVRTSEPTFYPFGDGWWTQGYNQRNLVHKQALSPLLGDRWWVKR